MIPDEPLIDPNEILEDDLEDFDRTIDETLEFWDNPFYEGEPL